MGLWGGHLVYSLVMVDPALSNPWMYVHVLIQAYLYTGLFITGHDAMHRTISGKAWINKGVGYLSVFLFAGMSYGRLIRNHWEHHKYPGTEKDPDFYVKSQNFFAWWAAFMFRYTTLWQILAMALIYNLCKHLLRIPDASLLLFWIIPAFLSTFQLFYFGTFVPHRKPHTEQMGIHRARTLRKNHLWAMLSCYFFGYHREHHLAPGVPWWKLYQVKSKKLRIHD
jgi:beta-carotene ketolase (CrtW type)